MERYLRYPEQKGGLIELADGRLMGIIRGLLKFYSEDRGRTYSEPEPLLADGEQISGFGDPGGVLRLRSGAIGITYLGPLEPEDFPGFGPLAPGRSSEKQRALYFRKSTDEGQTWSPAQRVAGPGVAQVYSLHDTIICLQNGRLVWPCYGGVRGYRPTNPPKVEGLERGIGHLWYTEALSPTKIYYSDDEGETWSASDGDLMLWIDGGQGNLDALHEPTVAEAKDGRLVLLARCGQMRAVQSFSYDQGKTWTLPELSELNSANAPIRVRRIPTTGDLMVVWNQVTAEEHRSGYGRYRLSAAISKDSGQTWTNFRNIHVSPGLNESPRVSDPEPAGFVRPGSNAKPGAPMPDNPVQGYLRASYANFFFVGDEVLIEHDYWYQTDPFHSHEVPERWKHLTKDRNRQTSTGHKLSSLPRKLHILPLSWFYTDRSP